LVGGIEPGDVISRVDGVPSLRVLQQSEELISGSAQWKRNRALSGILQGPSESELEMETIREGHTSRTTIRRDRTEPLLESRPERVSRLVDGILYVDLTRVSYEDLLPRIEELAQARGLIFDMRGYPKGGAEEVLSHLSSEPLQSAIWMVPRTVYPDRVDPAGYDTSGRWNLLPRAPRFQGKLVFLTHAGAISYAESVMGIVEHYHLGEIVGQPTAGTNGNVNQLLLPGGYAISWTGMRVLKHDGSQHHLIGIQPTVPVERRIAAVRAGRDEYLEQALSLLR
jgi:C-terminal processing protease CtpA/Prc